MYFNSLNNVSIEFTNEDYDLQDLEIIEELSKYPNKVLSLSMIMIFCGFYLVYRFV